jgi:hypothetical protein
MEKYSEVLRGYTFVRDPAALRVGAYVRWIRDGHLTNGAFLVDVKPKDSGFELFVKNNGRFFSVPAEDVFVFQKLTADELLFLKFKKFAAYKGK